jgi:hypothetical protein
MKRRYTLTLTSDEIQIMDALVMLGMSVVGCFKNQIRLEDDLHQPGALIGGGIAQHELLHSMLPEGTIDSFCDKFKSIVNVFEQDREAGLLDTPVPSIPTVVRLDLGKDEAVVIAAMVSYCSATIQQDLRMALACVRVMREHVERVGPERYNGLLSRIDSVMRAALPEVDFIKP